MELIDNANEVIEGVETVAQATKKINNKKAAGVVGAAVLVIAAVVFIKKKVSKKSKPIVMTVDPAADSTVEDADYVEVQEEEPEQTTEE